MDDSTDLGRPGPDRGPGSTVAPGGNATADTDEPEGAAAAALEEHLAALGTLDGRPPAEQADLYEEIHRRLLDALSQVER